MICPGRKPKVAKKNELNLIHVVRRVVVSVIKDPMMSSAFLDVMLMSFAMKERMYTMA